MDVPGIPEAGDLKLFKCMYVDLPLWNSREIEAEMKSNL